ncbi:MAG: inosose dehydratase, partial [Gaiellales bacterium]|nr:inosose dehydratase [Gaiellales bacterium]
MTPRVAAAPCSYGVFEITIGRQGLPDGPALVEAIAEGGYAGTELGPPGYLGRGRETGTLLAEHDLQLAGSFLPLRFTREDA